MSVRTGVVLMTYGSPRDLDDVGPYMSRVRGGRAPDAGLVREFQRRYAAIGGSPLVAITTRQATALEQALNAAEVGSPYLVAAGMRFSAPSVAEAVASLASRGAKRILGVVLSPQYSPILMDDYATLVEKAAATEGVPATMLGAWHRDPAFVEALARRTCLGLLQFPESVRDSVPVLMTAHSLPKRVVDREPAFIEQLHETARLVAAAAELAPDRWHFAYQSAGHSAEEWLKPDMLDVLPELAAQGHRHVLVAPVQFFADHLETLYDIDIAGREQAETVGFTHFARVPAPNDADDFMAALAGIVRTRVAAWQRTPPARSGALSTLA